MHVSKSRKLEIEDWSLCRVASSISYVQERIIEVESKLCGGNELFIRFGDCEASVRAQTVLARRGVQNIVDSNGQEQVGFEVKWGALRNCARPEASHFLRFKWPQTGLLGVSTYVFSQHERVRPLGGSLARAVPQRASKFLAKRFSLRLSNKVSSEDCLSTQGPPQKAPAFSISSEAISKPTVRAVRQGPSPTGTCDELDGVRELQARSVKLVMSRGATWSQVTQPASSRGATRSSFVCSLRKAAAFSISSRVTNYNLGKSRTP